MTTYTTLSNISQLSRIGNRNMLANDIQQALHAACPWVDIETTRNGSDLWMTMRTPELSASVDIDAVDPTCLLTSWYGAKSRLAPVVGAWWREDINASHGHKATSFPATPNELVSVLVAGFQAAAEGDAFEPIAAMVGRN